jgi:hypothetical protein
MEPGKTPKKRQTEEEDHEQEHEDINGHTNPRYLKWGGGRGHEKQG